MASQKAKPQLQLTRDDKLTKEWFLDEHLNLLEGLGFFEILGVERKEKEDCGIKKLEDNKVTWRLR